MAEDKKKRTRKSPAPKKDTKAPKKTKTTMRAKAAKTRAEAVKPKRVRKAASAAVKPISKTRKALTAEYHLTQGSRDGFFTKSRKLTPKYFRNAWKELKNVTWPGRKETWRLVLAVFIFAIAMGVSIAVLDYGLEKVLREIIL